MASYYCVRLTYGKIPKYCHNKAYGKHRLSPLLMLSEKELKIGSHTWYCSIKCQNESCTNF